MGGTQTLVSDVSLPRRAMVGASEDKGSQRWVSGAALALALVALGLWALSLQTVDLARLNDYGLVSVLPPAYFAALGLLIVGFSLSLRNRQVPTAVMLVQLVVLIVILHGTAAWINETPRYAWVYKHIGVTSYIQRYGSVDPSIDAYHNWPGFFAVSAFFTDLAGFESPLQYALWAQVFFNLLYLGPLLLILKACTTDRRLVWLGVWFFYLANWVGQDYFAPQALGYFFHLVILGICLTWFTSGAAAEVSDGLRWPRLVQPLAGLYNRLVACTEVDDAPAIKTSSLHYVSVMVVLILGYGAVVASHQLTPFMTVAAVTALVMFKRCSARYLPILMGVMLSAWLFYVAIPFLSDYTHWYSSFGDVSANVVGSVHNIQDSSVGRTFVAWSARLLTVGVWGLGMLGVAWRWRHGYKDLSMALLALAPFPMIAAQSYGTEMAFRIFLFSLPGMVFFVAALLYPRPTAGTSPLTTVLVGLTSGVLLTGFCFAHYGDERMNYFTQDELDGVRYLYQTAPPGSLIVSLTYNFPYSFAANYNQFTAFSLAARPEFSARSFDTSAEFAGDVGAYRLDEVTRFLVYAQKPSAYLVLSQSQEEHAELYGLLPKGWLDTLRQSLKVATNYQVVYEATNMQIYRYVGQAVEK